MHKQLLFFIFLLLASCTYTGEFAPIKYQNEFQIEVPDYLEKCDDFGGQIDLKNRYRNTYFFVKSFPDTFPDLANFQQQQIELLKNYDLLENPVVTDSNFINEANYEQINIELYGVIQEENIYYWHTSIKAVNSRYYELVGWTRSMDRRQKYGPDIEKIIGSFTVL